MAQYNGTRTWHSTTVHVHVTVQRYTYMSQYNGTLHGTVQRYTTWHSTTVHIHVTVQRYTYMSQYNGTRTLHSTTVHVHGTVQRYIYMAQYTKLRIRFKSVAYTNVENSPILHTFDKHSSWFAVG